MSVTPTLLINAPVLVKRAGHRWEKTKKGWRDYPLYDVTYVKITASNEAGYITRRVQWVPKSYTATPVGGKRS